MRSGASSRRPRPAAGAPARRAARRHPPEPGLGRGRRAAVLQGLDRRRRTVRRGREGPARLLRGPRRRRHAGVRGGLRLRARARACSSSRTASAATSARPRAPTRTPTSSCGRTEPPPVDALTVNPYLGSDSIEPFVAACRRSRQRASSASSRRRTRAAPTSRTSRSRTAGASGSTSPSSSPSGAQELVGERGLSSVGAVVGATYPRAVAEARKLMPQAILLLPGIGAQGATPGRRRARLHERAGERARPRLARGHLRVPRRRRRLAQGRGRRGGAAPRRGLDRVRDGRPGPHRASGRAPRAPLAFFVAATLLVLLVQRALERTTGEAGTNGASTAAVDTSATTTETEPTTTGRSRAPAGRPATASRTATRSSRSPAKFDTTGRRPPDAQSEHRPAGAHAGRPRSAIR